VITLPTEIFSSRFGKRLFLLFILSAVLPVLTLAFLSFGQVSDQLLEQNRNQQRQDTKAVGMAIFERLTFLETELQLLESQRRDDGRLVDWLKSEVEQERLSTKYVSIGWVDEQQQYSPLFGAANNDLAITLVDSSPVSPSSTAVVAAADSSDRARVFVMVSDSADDSALVAEINADYLWNAEVVEGYQELCILGDSGKVLFCTEPIDRQLLVQLYQENTNSSSGYLDWTGVDGKQFQVNYWGIFLRSRFTDHDWTVVFIAPRDYIVQPVTDFQTTFAIFFIISVLLVLMLSTGQIRRILDPLNKLTEGIREFGDSHFDNQVVIDSNDEFSDLAQSFNAMGGKLSEQFHSLETMAEIDRLILSSLDTKHIVETVLIRIHDIIRCDQIAIMVPDSFGKISQGYFRSREQEDETSEVAIEFSSENLKQLQANPDGLVVSFSDQLPAYLNSLIEAGAVSSLVLPLFFDDSLSAIIALGYLDLPADPGQDLQEARSWADRVAVALSNAQWQEKLYHQAHYDSLTGLPNRPACKDFLQQQLARAQRNNTMVGVMFIDLDRFKLINDSLGHASGDEYLRIIAERIKQCVRDTDMVARLGGDEFTIIILDNAQHVHLNTTISLIAQKLLHTIPAPLALDGHELRANASIGVSIYPADATNIEDLMKNADSAMYEAKASGGGSFRFYSEHLNVGIQDQFRMETGLRNALVSNELEVYYQPQVAAASGETVGAEALLRWFHPQKGLISPSDFISLAEETLLIVDVDTWVLNAVCSQLRQWQLQGRPTLRVSVNLSARFIQQEKVVEQVSNIAHQHSIRLDLLELEITEGSLIEDLDKLLIKLVEFERLGVKLAIDDFGTGYSSLSYLKKLPVHKLKIDQSFIRNCDQDKVDAALVKTIITMAQNLNLKSIAEGVETEEQLALLRWYGCDEIQGYLYSPALANEDFAQQYLDGLVPGASVVKSKQIDTPRRLD